MKPNNNFNLTHSLLQTVREVVAQEASEQNRQSIKQKKKAMPKKKESTVMIAHGTGGGVKVIPKSQYNPKIHDLADEKESTAAPVAKVDAKKMDRRKIIAKTMEKKKNGFKLSGKAEFVDIRPKMYEEVEQIDELSPNKLKNYVSGAKKSYDNLKSVKIAGDDETAAIKTRMMRNRTKGVNRAIRRLVKENIDLSERKMSDTEMKKREHIVKGMKKKLSDFRSRYGSRAKEVMYATATKKAMMENSAQEEIAKTTDNLIKT